MTLLISKESSEEDSELTKQCILDTHDPILCRALEDADAYDIYLKNFLEYDV